MLIKMNSDNYYLFPLNVVIKMTETEIPLKLAIADFQYVHSPSSAMAAIAKDNTHEREYKGSLIQQIIEELRRQKHALDSALTK